MKTNCDPLRRAKIEAIVKAAHAVAQEKKKTAQGGNLGTVNEK